MIYNKCPLFELQSKKVLSHLLKIPSNQYYDQKFIASKIHPYIEINSDTGKRRLIEPPEEDLKIIQTRIKNLLSTIIVPAYVFSGVKKRSYVDNAKLHIGTKYLYKTDFTAFFPSTPREKVYIFFRYKLKTSPDVAEFLTNITTVDLNLSDRTNIESINNFLLEKGVTIRNHLISGAPTSQIMSYLANIDMFDELYNLSQKYGISMSIYVDDITFSSSNNISNRIVNHILNTFQKYGFKISKHKVILYPKRFAKLVTGVVIDSKGELTLKNSLRQRILFEFDKLKKEPNNIITRQRLRGLVTSARQIVPNAFPSIRAFAFDKNYKIN